MHSASRNFARGTQRSIDSAAARLQDGIGQASDVLTEKVEDIRRVTSPMIGKFAGRTHAAGRQSFIAANDAAQRARKSARAASRSLVSYTQENPAKTLLLVAATGAVVFAFSKLLSAARR